jgi:(p)ppGpp synthase/HD superfamily hydrolase
MNRLDRPHHRRTNRYERRMMRTMSASVRAIAIFLADFLDRMISSLSDVSRKMAETLITLTSISASVGGYPNAQTNPSGQAARL